MYSASCSATVQAVLRLCAHCDGHLLCCRTRVCAWLPLAFWLGAVMVMRVALRFWQGLEGIYSAWSVCPPLGVAALPFWLLVLVVVALPFWRTLRL